MTIQDLSSTISCTFVSSEWTSPCTGLHLQALRRGRMLRVLSEDRYVIGPMFMLKRHVLAGGSAPCFLPNFLDPLAM